MGSIKIEKVLATPEEAPEFEKNVPPLRHGRVIGRWWLSFDMVVGPGERQRISAHPPIIFRGQRLSVDPKIAEHFMINEVMVGKNSMRLNDGHGAAATLFPPLPIKLTAVEREDFEDLLAMQFDTCNPQQTMTLIVTNHASERKRFNAVVWGISPDLP